jgi:hypothetical protein
VAPLVPREKLRGPLAAQGAGGPFLESRPGSFFESVKAQTALEEAKHWVRTYHLLYYTSETLNWIERFWEQVKDTSFSRMLMEEREAFYSDAVRLLHYFPRPGTIRKLMLRMPP